ncbi:MAG: hypothetical protein WCW44_04055 [archaeon]|jgi:hypothetical protein
MATTQPKPGKGGLRVLAARNQKYHLTAPRTIERSVIVKARLGRVRRNYLSELSKRKGLEWVNTRTPLGTIANKSGYELIGTGIKGIPIKIIPLKREITLDQIKPEPHKIAFILDPLGRIRFFCAKDVWSRHLEWNEIRQFKVLPGNKPVLEAKEMELASSATQEDYDIHLELNKHRHSISYIKQNAIRTLILLRRLL